VTWGFVLGVALVLVASWAILYAVLVLIASLWVPDLS
jgi:hypothetical protein